MLLIYSRCSTTEQAAEDKSSLELQDRVGRGYAMSKGFSQFDVSAYVDAGVSGSVALGSRPAGRRMRDDAKPGDVIFAAKLDRMFRSASDALYQVEFFKKHGIKLVLFDLGSEPIADSAIGQFFFTCMAAVATLERATIKERCTNGRKAKVLRGGHGGGRPPFGYRIVGKGRDARLEKVEAEQQILARVRAYLTERAEISIGETCRRLAAEGIASRNGKPFVKMQVSRIMEQARRDQ